MREDRQGSEAGKRTRSAKRPVVYCVVPRDLAAKLHEPLRRHFGDDPGVEVIVERRRSDRRGGADRRRVEREPEAGERRLIHNVGGRRVGDQRSPVVEVDRPELELPRRARAHADRLMFVERLEPAGEDAEDLDSARLVTRFQAGDRDAFATLYLRYFERVYGYLRMLMRQRDEAEDATQQVFMQVLEALPRYERRDRPFRTWLFVVVRNQALDVLEQQRRVEPLDPHELRRRGERLADDTELQAVNWISDKELVLFLERLPLPQRQVLLLRFSLGLGTAQIAQVLDREPDAVRQLQSRALAFLRARLSAIGRHSERREKEAGSRAAFRQTRVARARRFSLLRPGPTG